MTGSIWHKAAKCRRSKSKDPISHRIRSRTSANATTLTDRIPPVFQWLRTPEWERFFSLSASPGHLRLYGRKSIGSWFEQALVARRQTAWSYTAETAVVFQPETYQQLAGLICYYDRARFHYLAVSADDEGRRVLQVISCLGDQPDALMTFALEQDLPLPDRGGIYLGVDVHLTELQFRWSEDGVNWTPVGPILDASILSTKPDREHTDRSREPLSEWPRMI